MQNALVDLPTLTRAAFLKRPNRFLAQVQVDVQKLLVHVPNTGRMRELLTPQRPILLRPATPTPSRRTGYDLVLVELGQTLVLVDSRLPPHLVEEAPAGTRLAPFHGLRVLRREPPYGESRLDLLLGDGSGTQGYVETKSCNRVEAGLALFPDAVTTRGVRHLQALSHAVALGHRAAVVFTVQRSDATAFGPDSTDPAFGQALRNAVTHGVEVLAYPCTVTPRRVKLGTMPRPLAL